MTVLHAFSGIDGDGALPTAPLIAGPSGSVYGTTLTGGFNDAGVVFQLTPPTRPGLDWTEHILYEFTGGIDGRLPMGNIVIGAGGKIYGTTYSGGAHKPNPWGTLYELSPPTGGATGWTETVLHSFDGSDGRFPESGLTMDSKGRLYGTTFQGGSSYACTMQKTFFCGVVFEFNPPAIGKTAWTESILHEFSASPNVSDGADPMGALFIDNRRIYGTTTSGTLGFGNGTVFALTPPTIAGGNWTENILHAFAGGTDGATPFGGPLGMNGALYGTTFNGGSANAGTVYQICCR